MRRQVRSVGRGVVLALVAWIVVPVGIAEIGVRLWRPGFPGFRLPQVMHRPAEPYGFELVPNQRVFNVAAPVSVNSLGFRGPELRSRSGVGFRVLCIGDSFTFGYGVSDDDTYPRQLEKLLWEGWPERNPEVVNAGVQGYATYHEMDFLQSRGLSLEPDAVVLAVYHNDLEVRPKGNYAEQYQHDLERAESTLRHRAPRLQWALHNSATYSLASQLYRARQLAAAQRGRKPVDADDAAWHSVEEEVRRFRRLSEKHGFYPLVIVIPQRFQLTAGGAASRYPDEMLAIAERLGLDAIDLRPVLLAAIEAGIDPYLAWDHHHGPEGNLRLATVVRDRLTRAILPREPPPRAATGAGASDGDTAHAARAPEGP